MRFDLSRRCYRCSACGHRSVAVVAVVAVVEVARATNGSLSLDCRGLSVEHRVDAAPSPHSALLTPAPACLSP